jgi:hypothetical protein
MGDTIIVMDGDDGLDGQPVGTQERAEQVARDRARELGYEAGFASAGRIVGGWAFVWKSSSDKGLT